MVSSGAAVASTAQLDGLFAELSDELPSELLEVMMLSLALVAMSLVMASLLRNRPDPVPRAEALQRGLLFWLVGVGGLLSAYGHTGLAVQTALQLGWSAGSPFQFQVAMAYVAFGVLGLASEWLPSFRTPAVVGSVLFLLGLAAGDIRLAHQLGTFPLSLNLWVGLILAPGVLLICTAIALARHAHRPA